MKGAIPYAPPTADELEVRRPGIKAIIEELKAQFPNCTEDAIHAYAKVEWHTRKNKRR